MDYGPRYVQFGAPGPGWAALCCLWMNYGFAFARWGFVLKVQGFRCFGVADLSVWVNLRGLWFREWIWVNDYVWAKGWLTDWKIDCLIGGVCCQVRFVRRTKRKLSNAGPKTVSPFLARSSCCAPSAHFLERCPLREFSGRSRSFGFKGSGFLGLGV